MACNSKIIEDYGAVVRPHACHALYVGLGIGVVQIQCAVYVYADPRTLAHHLEVVTRIGLERPVTPRHLEVAVALLADDHAVGGESHEIPHDPIRGGGGIAFRWPCVQEGGRTGIGGAHQKPAVGGGRGGHGDLHRVVSPVGRAVQHLAAGSTPLHRELPIDDLPCAHTVGGILRILGKGHGQRRDLRRFAESQMLHADRSFGQTDGDGMGSGGEADAPQNGRGGLAALREGALTHGLAVHKNFRLRWLGGHAMAEDGAAV